MNEITDILWGGITYDEVVQGGPICVESSSKTQRVIESIIACGIAVYILHKVWPRISADISSSGHKQSPHVYSQNFTARALLCIFGIIFGIEVGFKLATRSLIWLFFPCHFVSMTILV